MHLNRVIECLTNEPNGFKALDYGDTELGQRLRLRNLEVWQNEHRVIVTKGYSSYAQFETWIEDQIVISYIYDELSTMYRNNLYFLLVLDCVGKDTEELSWKITEAEKNHRVCRKYVIVTSEDLERVPSFNNRLGKGTEGLFDFDEEFKTRLFSARENEKISDSIYKIVDMYFKQYDDQDELKQEKQKEMIHTILKGAKRSEN